MVGFWQLLFMCICRVGSCIAAGEHNKLDPAIDGGKWWEAKEKEQQHVQPQQHPPDVAVLPILGWKAFPSRQIPRSFNYGNIYHHIVESVQNLQQSIPDEDSDDDCPEDVDIHTAKPLRKGKSFFTSGHVQDMKDNDSDDFYFLKCLVKSSLGSTYYHVSCTLSKSSAVVKDAYVNARPLVWEDVTSCVLYCTQF